MAVDPVSDLLAAARDSRLLPAADLDRLLADPARPAAAADLAGWLLSRGAVTPFQADRATAGKPLRLAGYALAADLGPTADGHDYLARHPSLRDPVLVRAVATPDPDRFAARAREASTIAHPHLAHLLDAGITDGQPFAAVEPFDGRPLSELVRDIGPMPTALACTFARQAADALAAAHARGLAHGDVRADRLWVGPLVESARSRRADGRPLRRPAGNAAAKLFDLGLTATSEPSPEDDVAGLGGTLAFLLAGRPLTAGELRSVRPDLPPELADLIEQTTAADGRPTAADLSIRLGAFAVPPPVEHSPAAADPHPSESGILPRPAGLAAPVVAPPPQPAAAVDLTETSQPWVATPYDGPSSETRFVLPDGSASGTRFTPPADEGRRRPPGKPMTAEDRARLKKLMWVGAGFWLVAAVLLVYFLAGFGGSGGNEPPPAVKKKR